MQLADLGNLTQPWSIDSKYLPDDPQVKNYNLLKAFKNTTKDMPIPLEDLEREYCCLTNQAYPIEEMVFVRSWMLLRVSSIIQFLHTIVYNNFPVGDHLARNCSQVCQTPSRFGTRTCPHSTLFCSGMPCKGGP